MTDFIPGNNRARDIAGLIGFLALCFAVSIAGAVVTASSVGTWYTTLHKPAFNPPNWIFAPVWTVLFVMMAVAAWQVWRQRGWRNAKAAMLLFLVQLVLNFAWTYLFFGQRAIGVALVEIVILLAAILATMRAFWMRDRVAGLLMIPYAGWVSFATLLNAAIWQLNQTPTT